jgi:hypothetical protein
MLVCETNLIVVADINLLIIVVADVLFAYKPMGLYNCFSASSLVISPQ